jgi:hypothetical protein
MKLCLCIILLLLPVLVHAVDGCKVVEFADHTEVVCEGDGIAVPASGQTAVQGTQPQSLEQAQEQIVTPIPEQPRNRDASDSANPAKTADPDQAAAPDATQRNATTVGPNPRSTRPSFADRNAAAAERKKMILEQRPPQN